MKSELFVGAFVYKKPLGSLLDGRGSPRSAPRGAEPIPKSSLGACAASCPASGAVSVPATTALGTRSPRLRAIAPVLLPGGTPSFSDSPSLERGPPSPSGREIVLLRGEGSSFPAARRGFTMGMHLFIRAGFIFMEKLLWAGVVLGESAGLLSHARSCHGGGGARGDRGWLPGPPKPPGGGCVSKEALGFSTLPLQNTSSLEDVAKQEPESAAFLA